MTLLGVQEPRLSVVPDGDTTLGEMAVKFAGFAGLTLYPWQNNHLRDMCRSDAEVRIGEDDFGHPKILARGRWSARETVTVVARQNGKGEILVARELAGVYLFGEKEILHTAHFMDTALDAQKRLWEVIEGNEALLYWWWDEYGALPVMVKGNGKECITFPNGAVIHFRTRTKKTGRGKSFDYLVLDECFDLPHETYAALSKTVRAREFAQVCFISSPVNRFEHAHGAVFSAKRWAVIDGAEKMMFSEWSPAPGDDPLVESTWLKSNPSAVDSGAGAQLEDIAADAAAAKSSELLMAQFLVETLGQGNWVPRDGEVVDVEVPAVEADKWASLVATSFSGVGESCLSVDISPDVESPVCDVVSATQTSRGVHLDVGYHGPVVVSDIADVVVAAVDASDPVAVVVDPKSPAGQLLPKVLLDRGIEVQLLSFSDVKAGTRAMLQRVQEGTVTHGDHEALNDAVANCDLRAFNDGREVAWRKLKPGGAPISALVAGTNAAFGLDTFEKEAVLPMVSPISIPASDGFKFDEFAVSRFDTMAF